MSNNTVLQIPLSQDLKSEATLVSKEYGFSSLQELVRVFLVKIARREAVVKIETLPIKISSSSAKRYAKIEGDFRKKRNIFQAENIDDLVGQLK